MHFAYEGFTQDGANRRFQFRGKGDSALIEVFCIEIDLLLFSQNRVPVQDGPQFCLQLLETASSSQPSGLDRLRKYSVVTEDFRPLLVERARKIAEHARKSSPRKPFRKPSVGSNLFLGVPTVER